MFISTLLGQIYSNVVPFVILLGILIFVHELGHFLVARFCGVRVEVFSLGFGKKILSYKKGDTTYCISLIPLGGYVKMFGEQPLKAVEGEESVSFTEEEKKVSFTHKNVWQRIAVVLAGPLMNFFFAALVFTFIAQIGEETRSAVISEVEPNSAAAQMGFVAGDKVIEIAGEQIQSYEDFQRGLNLNKNKSVSALVETRNKEKKNLTLVISAAKNPNIFSSEPLIGTIEGILPLARGTQIGVVVGSLAEKSGFKTGDEIKSISTIKVSKWSEVEKIFNDTKQIPSGKAVIEVTRQGADESTKSIESISLDVSNFAKISTLTEFGFENSDLYLEQVVKGSPAEQADLKKNDRIVSINTTEIKKWEQVLQTIKSFDGKEALNISVIRDGVLLNKKITPLVTTQMTALGQEDKRYTIGIMPMVSFAQPEMTVVKTSSIFASINKGFSRTIDISSMTVFSFVKLFQGEVSHKNIGGMISIGKAAKDSFEMGLQAFLMTMGILSVSLFILNL